MKRLLARALLARALLALALLALGEAAPAAYPVRVAIERLGQTLRIEVDGERRVVALPDQAAALGVRFEEPGPAEREIQVDGTDLLATQDRDRAHLEAIRATPLYAVAAWLRDEGSYSRWERARLWAADGRPIAEGRAAVERAALLDGFRLEAALRRPEAAARVWLVATPADQATGARSTAPSDGNPASAPGSDTAWRAGLELSRDRRQATWLVDDGRSVQPAATWFFPTQAAPFAAGLLHLLGRSATAAFGLLAAAQLAGWVVQQVVAGANRQPRPAPRRASLAPTSAGERLPPDVQDRGWLVPGAGLVASIPGSRPALPPTRGWLAPGTILLAAIAAGWLVAAGWVTVALYRQVPHVLDAVSYYVQAKTFGAGRLWLDAPPLVAQLEAPFQVVWEGRWFSQYPPGAAIAYALGGVVGLAWLVGPLSGLALILGSASAGRDLYGPRVGWAVLGLGVLSPFILFQAGSYLSHPVVGGLLAGALAAFARAEMRAGRPANSAPAETSAEASRRLAGAAAGGEAPTETGGPAGASGERLTRSAMLGGRLVQQSGSPPSVAGLLPASSRGLPDPPTDVRRAVLRAPSAVGGRPARREQPALYALAGGLLGAAFLTREAATALFALPLVVWLLAHRRWGALGWLVAGVAPFLALYGAYNALLTGSPLLLPRSLFSAADRFGFGEGVGFYGRHTLAAGLANTDQNLTLLQFDLFGWPPLFALALLLVPFLLPLARPDRRDALLGGGALLLASAYAAYFYHGIVLGPRYVYEALPFLLVLAGRGLQVLGGWAERAAAPAPDGAPAGGRHRWLERLHPRVVAPALLVLLLSLNTLFSYLPRQVERRSDYVAFPDGQKIRLAFLDTTLTGPRVVGIPAPALVLTGDWWTYSVLLAPLNCPRPDLASDPAVCPRLFALARTLAEEDALRRAYPGRTLYRTTLAAGVLSVATR